MKTRCLLLLLVVLAIASASVLAQTTPPAQSTPPTPPAEPMNFSFLFEGSSYMGIVPEDINKENMSRYGLSSARGVGISRVSEGGPAEKAGLKKGDVILQFDGEPVTSNRKLLRLIGEAAPEQTVRLTISRNGSEQQVNVTLAKRSFGPRAYTSVLPQLPGMPQMPQTPRAWGSGPQAFTYSFGSSRRIGVSTTALTKQLADYFSVSGGHGLLITSVSENSPAAKAGLKAGDVVTELNGEKVEDTDDLIRGLNRKEEGEVTLTIIRDKSQRTIKVTPEKKPAPSFNFSELEKLPTLGRVFVPRTNMQNFPFSMFKVKPFVMPKIENKITPRIMTLPRIESILNSREIYY